MHVKPCPLYPACNMKKTLNQMTKEERAAWFEETDRIAQIYTEMRKGDQ